MNMNKPIGKVYCGDQNIVHIISYSEIPKLQVGDYVYVNLGNDVYMILQVVNISVRSLESLHAYAYTMRIPIPENIKVESTATCSYECKPILVVDCAKNIVEEPLRPPPQGYEVYAFKEGDYVSEKIMRTISGCATSTIQKPGTTIIGFLRAGRTMFKKAQLTVDFSKIVRKHILIVGQTGAGKTTCIVNWVTWYLLNMADEDEMNMSWLIIDRHGEYYRHLKEIIEKLPRIQHRIRFYKACTGAAYKTALERFCRDGLYHVKSILRVPASTITPEEFSLASDMPSTMAEALKILISQLESKLPELFERLGLTFLEIVKGYTREDISSIYDWASACLWYIVNILPYERKVKGGTFEGWLYPDLASHFGIYKNNIRPITRYIKSYFNFKLKRIKLGKTFIYYIDDSESMYMASPIFKDPALVLALTREALATFGKGLLIGSQELEKLGGKKDIKEALVTYADVKVIDEIIELLERGSLVVLDVSLVPSEQADLFVMTLLRQLFHKRLAEGKDPEEYLPIAIVSEEAPNYLSPDKVKDPTNIFAKIAREGRKFGIGLVAITQLVSLIEQQLLGNMNTIVAFRVRSERDLRILSAMGIRGEELPALRNFEAVLITVTPEIKVSFPLPVKYLPVDELKKEILTKLEKEEEELKLYEKAQKNIEKLKLTELPWITRGERRKSKKHEDRGN